MLEKFLKQTSFSSQEDFMQNFKVIVPENFNFGYDVATNGLGSLRRKKLFAGQMIKENISILLLPI